MPAAGAKSYQVGQFVVDTARYRLCSGDSVVPVEPKVFDLLVHLIRHRDRVLTREELFEAIWDGRPVSDATLSNHVSNARKALGDSGELQQTIQTIRGRGYQFVAAVTELDASAPAPEPDPAALPPDLPRPDAPPPTASPPTAPLPPAPSPTHRTSPVRRFGRWPWLFAPLGLLGMLALFGSGTLVLPGASPASERPYILVVPFAVSDNATDYHRTFADQLTREVIDSLRKISALRTVPQASAFQFRGDAARERVLERLPGVQFVLDGAVSVAPDGTLRITPRLADLRQDLDVWSSAFTVRIDDRNFFAAPAGIATAVAAALKVRIVGDEQRALAELPAVPQAYEPYAMGWHETARFTHESLQRALAAFDRAIALDPEFLAAYRARSDVLRMLLTYFESPRELLPVVEASLQSVLARDPDSAEAYSSLGLTQVLAWQWQPAWRSLTRARSLDPSLAQTELGFALYYAALGERAKVKAALARADELDPLDTELADWGTWALFMVGEREAARDWAESRMRQHPGNGFVFSGAGIAAYLRGDFAEGVALLQKGVELTERAPVALIMLAQGHGYAGEPDRVRPLLAEAEQANVYMCPYETAVAYLSLGDEASQDRAMALLSDAVSQRSNCLIFLRSDPRMRVLREHPRHAARIAELLEQVGLDDRAVQSYRR
jgi:DNA-binding winged helix-turn-helix (wHTH) protein/TolB-like protein/Tfp pilus assembly protein PilF